jgi:hypothetical protein
MRGHRLARIALVYRFALRVSFPPGHTRREQPILHIGHPQIASFGVFIDEPDTTDATVGFLDDGLRQRAEEPVDVGFAREQIERVLDDVSLHLRVALRASAGHCLAQQRGAKHFRIVGLDFRRTRRPLLRACVVVGHDIRPQPRLSGTRAEIHIVQKS